MMTRRFLLLAWAVPLVFGWTLGAADEPAHAAVTPVPRDGGPMERHLKINEEIKGRAGEVDLIFVGDSITQGWEGEGREVWEKHYAGRKVANLGIGGDRTQHVLWRLDNGNVDGISPKVAVVMIGTNNSGENGGNTAEEIIDGVTAVVRKLQEKLPETRVLLLGIFPRGETCNPQRGKILQVNQALHKLNGGRVRFLDFGHRFVDAGGRIPKELMPDFLHLSPQGYALWAEAIERPLARMLGERPGRTGAAVAAAETPAPPSATGDWAFSIEGPEGENVEAPMALRAADGKLTGAVEFEGGRRLEIAEGTAEGGNLSFLIRRDRPDGSSMVYRMRGKVEGDVIQGTVQTEFNGEEITRDWKAVRRPAAAAHALTGEWLFSIAGPDGQQVEGPLTLRVEGKNVGGTLEAGDAQKFELREGVVEGNALTFEIRRERDGGGVMVYRMQGTVDGDVINGKVTTEVEGQEITADWMAKRKP